MFKVEIKSEEVKTRSGSKDGRHWEIKEQSGWVHIPGKPYPQEVSLRLESNAPAYPVGDYRIAPSSFYVGRYGDLQVRIELEKVAQPAARQAG